MPGQRLRELEESGIVEGPLQPRPPRVVVQVYDLVERLDELESAVRALGRWASQSPSFPRGAEMGPDSLVLALKSTFQPEKADGLEAVLRASAGGDPLRHLSERRAFRGRPR